LTISLDQYEVPLSAPAPNTTTAADLSSSESSPVSTNSSPSSENSSVPSLPGHDLKTPSPVGDDQYHYLPGEDFRFLSDPAYCEYLVKSTVTRDATFDDAGDVGEEHKIHVEDDLDLQLLNFRDV
jgi:hypothetical protein